MHSLPVFLRLRDRPVLLLGEGETADAKRRLLARAGARIVADGDDAALAIVALDDPDAAAIRLRMQGVLVNVPDRPDLCDFTLPAIVDRDPVIVAIGTGGASAGLAKALRMRIEGLLPASLGSLASALQRARDAIRARWPDPVARRNAIDAALAGPLDPFADAHDVEAWLGAPDAAAEDGLIVIVIRSDDPDELTVREARLLGRADHVFHSPAVSPQVLDRARADAARHPVSAPPATLPAGLSLYLLGKAAP